MMAEPQAPRRQAVVLHLRSGAANPLALEAAARFARALRAEFESLFVEDDELLSLAELPFAREISSTGRRSRPLSASRLHREMRARSSAVQRDVERLARAGGLQWRCTVVRDAPAAALSRASERARILVLGEPLGSAVEPRAPALMACLGAVEGCVVVGARVRRMTGPVLIALDDVAALESMAEFAGHWTAGGTDEILLVLLGAALDRRAQVLRDLDHAFPGERVVTVHAVADLNPRRAVADLSGQVGAGLVIVRDRGLLAPDDAGLARLAGALECPLLLHRGEARPQAG